jgi:hypothetical protein
MHFYYFGGNIVKNMLDEKAKEELKQRQVNLFRMANQALDAVARRVCGREFFYAAHNGKGAS